MNFNTLPSLIALAILVVVFRAILRQGTSERLHLWLTGWILVLVHFVAQFVDVGQGTWDHIASAVNRREGKLIRPRPTISFMRHKVVMAPSGSAWAITMCRLFEPTSIAAMRKSVRAGTEDRVGRRVVCSVGMT